MRSLADHQHRQSRNLLAIYVIFCNAVSVYASLMSLSPTTNCLLCGSKARPLLSTQDYMRSDPTVYDLNWCDQCSFGRLAGSLTAEQVLSFYPEHYYTHVNQFAPQETTSLLHRLRT